MVPNPQQADPRVERARELHNTGAFEAADKILSHLVSKDPRSIRARMLYCYNLFKLDQLKSARQQAEHVIALDPGHAGVRRFQGLIAAKEQNWEEAADCYEEAVRLDADGDQGTWVLLSEANLRAGRPERAKKIYERFLDTFPNSPTAPILLSQMLEAEKDLNGADAALELAVERQPDNFMALTNLGNLRLRQGDIDSAHDLLLRALQTGADHATVHSNIGHVFAAKGDHVTAAKAYRAALRMEPNNEQARVNLAVMLLVRGDLLNGWREYAWRHRLLKTHQKYFDSPVPVWRGGDLGGQRLLIWSEQGIGDQILFMQLLPELFARGISCVVEVEPRLVPLFQRSFPEAEFVGGTPEEGGGLECSDLGGHISLMDLAAMLRPTLASLPTPRAFLKADPKKQARFRAKYGDSGKVVGLAWRSKNERVGAYKSASLLDWRDLLTIPGMTFVNLQYGDVSEELAEVRRELGVTVIEDPEVDSLKDLDGFAAQVAAMDLVISTSNAAVHVAGGLGVPTWTLLSKGGGLLWYWFLDRGDCAWYPNMTLLRQQKERDWSEIMSRIRGAFIPAVA